MILRKTDGKRLDETLNTKSGLLGISSVSGDMRQVIAAMRCGNGRAQLAFRHFVHRLPHPVSVRRWQRLMSPTQSSSLRARRGMQPLYVSGARRRYEQKHRCKCGSGHRRNRSESASARCTRPGRLGDRAGMLAAALEYQPSILAATTLDSTSLHGCPVIPARQGRIATLMTPSRRWPKSSYASVIRSSENVCVKSGRKSNRPWRTSSMSLRIRSFPPGHSVVTIL